GQFLLGLPDPEEGLRIERLGFFAAFEDPEIGLQSVHQIEPKEGMDGRPDDPGRVLTLGKILDLLSIEEKEVGYSNREIGIEAFVPVLGEQFVRLPVPAHTETLLNAFAILPPRTQQLEV